MYDDLRLIVDNKRINYITNITKNKIMIKCNDINNNKLEIYYDDNIYNIILKDKNSVLSSTININLTKEEQKEFSFILELKDNYLVKSIYKYINRLIDKDKLIEEITLFKDYNNKKEYKNSLNKLIKELNSSKDNIEELLLNNESEYNRLVNILLNNDTYKNISNKMSIHELMLLITWYISMPIPPIINQELFNNLVNDAINNENSLENVWRIAMNYDEQGYNYDLIDEFFINSKDEYYISEYISGVLQVDQEKIINMLIESKDKDLITKLLEKYTIASNLDNKYIEILKEYISKT